MASDDFSKLSEPLSPLFKLLYDKVKSSKEKRTMVAIDIGATHTRYAYLTEKVFLKESVDESLEYTPWHQDHKLDNEQVFREPTSIVLDGENQCVAFGNKAEEIMTDVNYEKDSTETLYFHKFIRQLYYGKSGSSITHIKDINGKTAETVEVLCAFLRTLVDQILETIDSDSENKIDPRTIRWVFTYPEISNHAKMIIHESAQKAGISYSNIYVLPETEAAQLYCQNRLDSIYGTTLHMTTATASYLVVLFGDHNSYSILHTTLPNGQITTIDKADENIGDVSINEYFMDVLSEILRNNALEELSLNEPALYVGLVKELEKAKRRFCELSVKSNTSITLNISKKFNEKILETCGEDLRSMVELSKYSRQIVVNNASLVLKEGFMEALYTKALQRIEKLILKNVRKASHVYLIGSFSECRMIQNFVRKRFHDVIVIVPEGGSAANLEGAAIYAYQQQEQWFKAKFGCPVRGCESYQKVLRWMCMENDCRSPLQISSWGNLKCEDEIHSKSICFWKFQCGLHEKIGPDFDIMPSLLFSSNIMHFQSIRVLSCLKEKLTAQRVYIKQNPDELAKGQLLSIESGSMDDAGEKFIPLVLRCPVKDCQSKENIIWKCTTDNCNSLLHVSNWGNIQCQRQLKSADGHHAPINLLLLQCGSHGYLPANLMVFDTFLMKSQNENELWTERFQKHLKLKLQTQMNQTPSTFSQRHMLAADNKWLNGKFYLFPRLRDGDKVLVLDYNKSVIFKVDRDINMIKALSINAGFISFLIVQEKIVLNLG